jgi:hypothetical protein
MVRDTTAWILRATAGRAVVVLLSTALAARHGSGVVRSLGRGLAWT